MKYVLLATATAALLNVSPAMAQTPPAQGTSGAQPSENVPTQAMVLATVHIPRAVKADDQLLKAGTYRVRLAGDPLKPAVGETPNLEQWVEFLQGSTVKGKAVASIVPPDQIHQVAETPVPKPGTARVELLKGNDYVRIWINKGGNSYLIHLPTATS